MLDNGEHLVEAVADLAVDLLRACPNLAVLATSRVVLDVPGEVAWQLPPLGLPAEDTDLTDVAALATSPAVQLFVARAAEARHGFELHAGNAAAVVAVVRRLDGLPLGIELAAARVRSLPPERIAIGLDDALAFLSSRSSRRLSRQRNLEASIGWSYGLLAEPERLVLRRLSVFAGSIPLGAAEAVVTDYSLRAEAVVDALDRLVEHSLLAALDEPDGGPRYRLLELVRQFARHRLDEEDAGSATRARHADFFLELVASRCDACERDPAVQDAIVRQMDDVRAALRHAERHDPRRYAEAVLGLRGLWIMRPGFLLEARAEVGRAIATVDAAPSLVRTRLLALDSHLAILARDPLTAQAVERCAEALAETEDAWSRGRMAFAESNLAILGGAPAGLDRRQRGARTLRCGRGRCRGQPDAMVPRCHVEHVRAR